ncbi:MarR family winged helix-turn-helix transcriptional regulator [Arhodomonas aquaeolei]|uniref:MarR family winged helix-turn-helix transcriptional regulator n=1 Tax=Arhodomonas aquaeolei TaxID=2369 RepID=UPI000377D729|nr:MarR family transcriptional regulator [Arhodomonas aquaeolei]
MTQPGREHGGATPLDEATMLPHSKRSLRAWLHLIKCSKRVEQAISDLFRDDFDSSLSRFDVLAHLDYVHPEALSTSALAQRLLASKGNITRLLDRMEGDGLIHRRPSSRDRRVSDVYLTDTGTRLFHAMADAHEAWSDEIFGILNDGELDELVGLLDRVRHRLEARGDQD